MRKKKISLASVLKVIGKIISWALFILLLIAAIFLLYYYIATKIYASKGEGYEPKFSIYTIISESMTPNINVYDAVVDMRPKDPNDIKVGDVITFKSTSILTPGITNTHRVIAITTDEFGEVCYKTKGDYNNVADEGCAKFSNVYGKVIFKIPQLGRLQKLLSSKGGWLFFILIPALIIIIKDILKITRLSNVNDKATKISEKPKPNAKKQREEAMRKEQLKKKLLKEEKATVKEYYQDPVIRTVEKNNKKETSQPENIETRKSKNNKKKKKNN